MTCGAHWEHFPHQADIGVRGFGPSQAQAFAQAALALTAVITEPRQVLPRQSLSLCFEAPDPELLLVEWLNGLIFEMATRHWLFSRFELRLTAQGLEAIVWGEAVDLTRHQPAVEVKGATFTELAVQEDEEGCWVAQCVVDV